MNKSKEEPTSTSFNRQAGCYHYVYLRGKSSTKKKGTGKGSELLLSVAQGRASFIYPQKALQRYSTGQNKAYVYVKLPSAVLKIIPTWTLEMG